MVMMLVEYGPSVAPLVQEALESLPPEDTLKKEALQAVVRDIQTV
jgi:hypothetical protein